jgi:hypothetical protein
MILSRLYLIKIWIGTILQNGCDTNETRLLSNTVYKTYKEWRDTRTFSNLKSTHCTLLILLIINLVTKKFK